MEPKASGAVEGGEEMTVGIVGGGQLARMLCEKASELGVSTIVLCERADDPAATVATKVIVGTPHDERAMVALSASCDVITFDHEQVDLDILRHIVDSGHLVRPGLETLAVAVDKAAMRQRLFDLGHRVPHFAIVDRGAPASDYDRAIDAVGKAAGFPIVIKPARGGYDGKGVFVARDRTHARELLGTLAPLGKVVVEVCVELDTELAVIVARNHHGDCVAYPAVVTAQVDGMCREVLVPGELDHTIGARAQQIAAAIADDLSTEGILAVEFFVHNGELSVCELAARPHNSGHWTIEGATCSQFENHLRAVLDLPLGATTPTGAHIAMVNVIGSSSPGSLRSALRVEGAHIHSYAKAHRPGRKLGHVTVVGNDAHDVRARAWMAAVALGTEQTTEEIK